MTWVLIMTITISQVGRAPTHDEFVLDTRRDLGECVDLLKPSKQERVGPVTVTISYVCQRGKARG